MSRPTCLWSGPRNVSTALMYSFAQRADTRVVDEPLYGHYLRVSGADHPGRDDVLASMNCDGAAVMREQLSWADRHRGTHLFLKHMAHHLIDLDLSFMARCRHVLLIRDPADMLPSLKVQLPHPTLADTGLNRQWELYESLTENNCAPVVVDSRELLREPRKVLQQLCDAMDLAYSDCMLSWPKGPRPEDGIWARHWYSAVHRSSGFAAYRSKDNFPAELEGLLAECRPWYDKLYTMALRAT
ncbi:MAG: sulfotransferase family protein [Gammaproteobacteria bacterium]|nr:sulfotransferase family protein [Gammaproteobacteria bacterium]